MVNKRRGFWRIWVVLWVLWALFWGTAGVVAGLQEGAFLGLALFPIIGLFVPPLIWKVGDWIYQGFTTID